MTIEIIGAGFGRTGTHTLKLALQHLGFSKCYHMEELVMNPESLHYWEDARHGKQVNWDELFKGYRAAVDFPTNMFYTDLMQHYPDAKVILTMRDPESWYKSFGSTIIRQSKPSLKQIVSTSFKLPFNQKLRQQLKIFKYAGKFLDEMFGGRFDEDKEKMINIFNSRNDHIKNTIPPEKLLIYEVKDGWAPLCNFLGRPVPDKPFPHSNTTAEFQARTS